MFVILCLSVSFFLCHGEDGLTPVTGTNTEILTDYEKYKDFIVVSADNVTQFAFNKKDTCIVIFHNDDLTYAWKKAAAAMRGIAWVGVCVKNSCQPFLEKLSIHIERTPAAVVLPYGLEKFKKRHHKLVFDSAQAKSEAASSLPDSFIKLTADGLQDLLIEAFSTSPTKFPVIYIHDEDVINPTLRALALRFQKYFLFGSMKKPAKHDLEILGVEYHKVKYPSLLVLVTASPIDAKLSGIFYDMDKFGDWIYPNLVKFLLQLNEDLRYQLPGDNASDQERVAKLLDIVDIEKERFDFITTEGSAKRTSKKAEL